MRRTADSAPCHQGLRHSMVAIPRKVRHGAMVGTVQHVLSFVPRCSDAQVHVANSRRRFGIPASQAVTVTVISTSMTREPAKG